jgi:hypothetical protein
MKFRKNTDFDPFRVVPTGNYSDLAVSSYNADVASVDPSPRHAVAHS